MMRLERLRKRQGIRVEPGIVTLDMMCPVALSRFDNATNIVSVNILEKIELSSVSHSGGGGGHHGQGELRSTICKGELG
jgi:hypothetical protein